MRRPNIARRAGCVRTLPSGSNPRGETSRSPTWSCCGVPTTRASRALPPVPGARVLDWSSAPGEPGYSPWWERKRLATRALTRAIGLGHVEALRQAAMSRLFDTMARQRVAFGYSVVSSGRVLVTDRLHGHILALLLGVPHVVMETGYGKVRGFNESFSGRMNGVAYCDDDACVESEVRRLLARG